MRSWRSLTNHIPSFGLPALSVAFVEMPLASFRPFITRWTEGRTGERCRTLSTYRMRTRDVRPFTRMRSVPRIIVVVSVAWCINAKNKRHGILWYATGSFEARDSPSGLTRHIRFRSALSKLYGIHEKIFTMTKFRFYDVCASLICFKFLLSFF